MLNAVTTLGHLAAGRTDAAGEIADELRADLPTLVDPVDRWWATFAIVQIFDPDTLASDAEDALAAARAVGAAHLIGDALRAASTRWYFIDPPRFDRVIAELDEAIRLHESVGASSAWDRLTLTWARTMAGDEQASDTLHEAIVRMYDERNWGAIDGTLETAPVVLAGEAPTVAATIYGYLEGSPPPWGRGGVDIRALAADVVDAIPDAEVHRARGAAKDRHEIVALTLAALEHN